MQLFRGKGWFIRIYFKFNFPSFDTSSSLIKFPYRIPFCYIISMYFRSSINCIQLCLVAAPINIFLVLAHFIFKTAKALGWTIKNIFFPMFRLIAFQRQTVYFFQYWGSPTHKKLCPLRIFLTKSFLVICVRLLLHQLFSSIACIQGTNLGAQPGYAYQFFA